MKKESTAKMSSRYGSIYMDQLCVSKSKSHNMVNYIFGDDSSAHIYIDGSVKTYEKSIFSSDN